MNYGRHPRTVLDGFAPIAYELHLRDYADASAGRGPWYDEYLVEECADGTVMILPSDAMPYPGRQIWRREELAG